MSDANWRARNAEAQGYAILILLALTLVFLPFVTPVIIHKRGWENTSGWLKVLWPIIGYGGLFQIGGLILILMEGWENTPMWFRVIWSIWTGALALVLLYVLIVSMTTQPVSFISPALFGI